VSQAPPRERTYACHTHELLFYTLHILPHPTYPTYTRTYNIYIYLYIHIYIYAGHVGCHTHELLFYTLHILPHPTYPTYTRTFFLNPTYIHTPIFSPLHTCSLQVYTNFGGEFGCVNIHTNFGGECGCVNICWVKTPYIPAVTSVIACECVAGSTARKGTRVSYTRTSLSRDDVIASEPCG